MCKAIQQAFFDLTGKDAQFCFSGWNADLTDMEQSIVAPSKTETVEPKKAEVFGEGQETVLCLWTVKQDGTAHNGFKWPETGIVTAPDWDPKPECGNGLHGYLQGCGDAQSIIWDGLWQVVRVVKSEIVELNGEVKFPRCEVVFTGEQKEATDILVKEYPGLPVIGAVAADMRDGGTATTGDCGTATAGYRGTATAGNDGTAMAGKKGRISILYWDDNAERYREVIGYIGEDGLEPNVAYKLDETTHKFVKA